MKKNLPKKFYKKSVKPEAEAQAIVISETPTQFPKISLSIPERFGRLTASSFGKLGTSFLNLFRIQRFTNRVFIFSFMCGFLLTAIGVVGYDIQGNLKTLGVARQERQALEEQVAHLQSMISSHKNYRDGLYQLALLEQTLGRKQAAYEHITAALALDPDFIEGKALLEALKR